MVLTEIFSTSSYSFSPYSSLYFISTIVIITMGLYVWLKNPRSNINKSFLFMITCFFFWLFGMAMTLNSRIDTVAEFWCRFIYTGVIFIPYSTYIISIFYLEIKNQVWLLNLAPIPLTFFMMLNWFTDKFLTGTHPMPWGFFGTGGSAWHTAFIVYFCILASTSMMNYLFCLKKIKSPEKKKLVKIMAWSYFIGYFGSFDFIPSYKIQVYPLGFIPELIFAVFVMYVITRYKVYVIDPVFEEEQKKRKYSLKKGRSYLIRKNLEIPAMDIFTDQVLSGKNGLLVTRNNPQFIREETPLKKTPIIWLTEVAGESSIDPSRIEELANTITKFIEASSESIVLLEGLPYLISYSDFNLVLRFLRTIRDQAATKNSILMINVNQKNFSEQNYSLLRTEFQELTFD